LIVREGLFYDRDPDSPVTVECAIEVEEEPSGQIGGLQLVLVLYGG